MRAWDGARVAHFGGCDTFGEDGVRRAHVVVPFMAAQNNLSCAIGRVCRVYAPKGVELKWRARARGRAELVVIVPGLHGFARMQFDGEKGRQQATIPELGFGKS